MGGSSDRKRTFGWIRYVQARGAFDWSAFATLWSDFLETRQERIAPVAELWEPFERRDATREALPRNGSRCHHRQHLLPVLMADLDVEYVADSPVVAGFTIAAKLQVLEVLCGACREGNAPLLPEALKSPQFWHVEM